MSDEQEAAQEQTPTGQVDSSTLDDASEEDMDAFARRALDDLFPFVRSELYQLSGRLQGIYGVMLQPYPVVHSYVSSKAAPR